MRMRGGRARLVWTHHRFAGVVVAALPAASRSSVGRREVSIRGVNRVLKELASMRSDADGRPIFPSLGFGTLD